ncbi:MAG: tetraacyldisaccharide 4'-kinase [bacterium]|jgi:tetraacyldisaccharide 4'-kinase|nr:tetraacyldisaccharide 4'-kinase [bacterium]
MVQHPENDGSPIQTGPLGVSLWQQLAYAHSGPLRWAAPGLLPLSWLFNGIATSRRWLYRAGWLSSFSFPVPILSVGNLTVGGIGKTPFTIFLARQLRQMGFSPAILIRGYKRQSTEPIVLTPSSFQSPQVAAYGDEAVLLLRGTGCLIAIDGDRVGSARRVLQQTGCDCLLLDDGFQHLRLRRDLDLVLFSSQTPLGNGYTLPYGPLREPVCALNEADLLLFNGEVPATAWAPSGIPRFAGGLEWTGLQPFREWKAQPSADPIPVAQFPSRTIMLVSGIGNPQRLEDQARQQGCSIVAQHRFPDHQWFTLAESRRILALAKPMPIFLTEKDAVRLLPLQELVWENYPHTYVIRAAWSMRDEAAFLEWLNISMRRIGKKGR